MLCSKFRGSLVGALIGDCLGAPFEGDFPINKSIFNKYIASHMNMPSHKGPQIGQSYTDDTAMTLSLARSLVEKRTFDPVDVAKKFTEEYIHNPRRGYGNNVVSVFEALHRQDYTDVFGPAKKQFGGTGSYGNGGAMRIAPIALFFYNDENRMLEVARQNTLLTHTHKNGVVGALLQALSIREALLLNPLRTEDFSSVKFVSTLISKVEPLEKSFALKTMTPQDDSTPFTAQLRVIKRVLETQETPLEANEAAVLFGNSVSALKSVPTALYAFLRSHQTLKEFETDNMFLRTLYYGISLGGDTDTIASMACAIAGAYLGYEGLPAQLTHNCEGLQEVLEISSKLHDLATGQ